jgi:uncharacterized cupin superfamily protein
MSTPLKAVSVPARTTKSVYPAPFAQRMEGRDKRALGNAFGLTNFGVNLTTLQPGAVSALHHSHAAQDEFIYVTQGTLTLHLGQERHEISAGDCIGFAKGGPAHHLANESQAPAQYLEIGDRSPGDVVIYPNDDLVARGQNGQWVFTHKDGKPY